MNCQKAKPLIPLFIEADLAAAEMQRVTTHVETCDACREVVAEFQTSQSALRATTAPVFDEIMLVEMRRVVKGEIARMPARPPVSEWLLPNWNWKLAVAATAVLLCGSVIVMSWRGAATPPVQIGAAKDDSTSPSVNLTRNDPLAKTPIESQVFQPRTGRQNKAQGGVRASERNPGDGTTNPSSPERATEPDEPVTAASIAPFGANGPSANIPRVDTFGFTLPPAPQAENAVEAANLKLASPEPEMLRMEFQTADPNIKIIWLTPKEPTRTNPAAVIQ